MKIELYLKNINQEMIDAGRRVRGRGEAEWVVSWPKSCCILDFSMAPHDILSDPPMRGLMMRKDDEGGMFWDPKTGAVYKVDEEAYHTMLELDRGFSEREVARRMRISPRKVRGLTDQLRRIKARRS